MPKDFSQFRARFILLDLVIVLLGFVVLGLIFKIAGIELFKSKDQIVNNSLNSLMTLTLCFSIIRRLKKNGIQLQYLIGTARIQTLPWLKLCIVLYGFCSLSRGISQLTIFFTNAISPSLAESAIENLKLQYVYSYNTESLLLRILFYVLLLVSSVVVAPLTEEFIFRGLLLHRFAAKWGMISAILFSSFIFGAAHMNINSISLGVSSIVFSLIYIKTKALMVPILLHAANNLIAVGSGIINTLSPSDVQVVAAPITLWYGLLNTGFALSILLYFFKRSDFAELLPYTANLEDRNAYQFCPD
jgi:uncharacterized protein